MKKRKIDANQKNYSKKLKIDKKQIASLNEEELQRLEGGGTILFCRTGLCGHTYLYGAYNGSC